MSDTLIYSLPDSDAWTTLDLEPSAQGSDVVVQPFDGGSSQFKVVKVSDIREIQILDLNEAPAGMNASQREYEGLVSKGTQFCEETGGKVVCSRSADVAISINSSTIEGWLDQLRLAFPRAFVYFLKTSDFGIWMGATPETLVSKEGDDFRTVSFAGTRWNDDLFEEKEFKEQQVVTDSILQDLGLDNSAAGERHEVSYGAIRHLQTEIKWTSDESLLDVAKKLHPTPAVCGWPRGLAKSFILENESRTRRLYTGFIALQAAATNVAFVNLRCMQLFRDRIRFYVGGGVNSMSIPAMEWEETERKMRTLLDAMKINA